MGLLAKVFMEFMVMGMSCFRDGLVIKVGFCFMHERMVRLGIAGHYCFVISYWCYLWVIGEFFYLLLKYLFAVGLTDFIQF
jgi:hypothetical protein